MLSQYELFGQICPEIPQDCMERSADIARVTLGADTITEEVTALQEAAFLHWHKGGYSILCFSNDRPVMSFNALFRAVCSNLAAERNIRKE